VVAKGVLEDLVGPEREVGRVAGQVVRAQVRLDRGHGPLEPLGDRKQGRAGLGMPESVLEAV
jgi:hypothetical protein